MIDGIPINHDGRGNITERENGYVYSYNSSNQLTEVLKKGRSVGKYSYNPEGKRYIKEESNRVTYYLYGGEYILYEERPDGTEVFYIYLNGQTIAKVEKKSGEPDAKYFYHNDHLGSTRAVSDATGKVIGTVDYKPFGDEQPYFPGRDTITTLQSKIESVADISVLSTYFGTKTANATKTLSSGSVVEGNYAVVTSSDGNYTNVTLRLNKSGTMDTDVARYYYMWAKPVEEAVWMQVRFTDLDDGSKVEYLMAEDGTTDFRMSENGKWNLILLDARETNGDGIDRLASSLAWKLNKPFEGVATWAWDHMGVSVKDPVTFTGKQQDDPTWHWGKSFTFHIIHGKLLGHSNVKSYIL